MAGPGGGYQKGKLKSVESSRFSMVPRNDIPRSAFEVNHGHKTTFDGGWLIPIYVKEILPGDSLRMRCTAFGRLSTPIVPLMDNIWMEFFYFFVPNRLVWDNWARFMGEKASTIDVTAFLVPQVEFIQAELSPGNIGDYMGIVLNGAPAPGPINVSALPFRAYALIYKEWFKDQDLQDDVIINTDDGPDTGSDYALVLRNKRHDYFTSARPWPEKPYNTDTLSAMAAYPAGYFPGGNMTLPRGAVGAPVSGLGVGTSAVATVGPGTFDSSGARTETVANFFDSGSTSFYMGANATGTAPNVRVFVNDLRTAVAVQAFQERNARGGTRYTELVRSQFGVTSPDARLQRPEYLGGGRAAITINPVAQTSATGSAGTTTVLGELAGVGSALAQSGFSQSFTEHGYVIGLVNVRPDLTYQQGIERHWFRRTPFDFYVPALAHLGEQAIWSKELYADGSAGDDLVFGFQERWSEYKWAPSRTSGWFRSTAATPLDMWHVGEEFGIRPLLNTIFVAQDPPFARVLQTNTLNASEILFDSVFEERWARCMPMYSIPGLGPRL